MKKTLASIVLCGALLFVSGAAMAVAPRPAEPRWGIRSERTSPVSPLDLARWMARRLIEAVGIPEPEPTDSGPGPVTTPPPVVPNTTCPPDRVHCPLG